MPEFGSLRASTLGVCSHGTTISRDDPLAGHKSAPVRAAAPPGLSPSGHTTSMQLPLHRQAKPPVKDSESAGSFVPRGPARRMGAELLPTRRELLTFSRRCAVRRAVFRVEVRDLRRCPVAAGRWRSLTWVPPGGGQAALTRPGRVSTASWRGFGERDGKEYARNRRLRPSKLGPARTWWLGAASGARPPMSRGTLGWVQRLAGRPRRSAAG
jgi:hypothetical protein